MENKVIQRDVVRGPILGDYVQIESNLQDADFWLVRTGNSREVGEPTTKFNPLHIGIKVTRTDVLLPDYLWWLFVNLYRSGALYNKCTTVNSTKRTINLNTLRNIPMDVK